MRILITGGGGYLGCVLAACLSHTYKLRILDRFDWGLQPLLGIRSFTSDLEIVRGDIRDIRAVRDAAKDAALLIHLASIVGYPACDANPQDAETTNVDGTRIVCEVFQGRPILFASTGSTYGKKDGPCTEETPLSPLTRYGRTKAQGEQAVLEAGGTVLRLATLFGLSPRMRWDLLPHDFAKRGIQGEIRLFDGSARRTFLHVQDAARAFCSAIEESWAPGVWNVGDPSLNLTKRQVANLVHALTDCRITAVDGHDPDERDYEVSYHKIQQETSWRVAYNLSALVEIVDLARIWEPAS